MIYKDKFTLFALFVVVASAWAGVLFGFHTVVFSGILNSVATEFGLTVFQEGVLTGMVLLGGLPGSLFAGVAADRWGRKKILLAVAAIVSVGTIVQIIFHSYALLLSGRLITGIGIGLGTVVAPLYLAEVSPPHYRGRFISTYQLMMTAGIVLAYAANLVLAEHFRWETVLYFGLLLSLVQFMALFFIPETPAWLMRHSQKDSAVDALSHLRRDTSWQHHLIEMKKTAAPRTEGKLRLLFQRPIRRLVIIGVFLSLFQQITGINTVFYYAPKILAASAASSQNALTATLVIGIVNFFVTLVAVVVLDKLGRRTFLLGGVFAMFLGQMLLACCSQSAIAGILGTFIFVAGFALSLGPVTWILLSEIYPLKIRGKAVAIALFANWSANYLVALTFLILIEKLGLGQTFAFYGAISFICLIFIYFFIPETKGKSLEEIEFLANAGKL